MMTAERRTRTRHLANLVALTWAATSLAHSVAAFNPGRTPPSAGSAEFRPRFVVGDRPASVAADATRQRRRMPHAPKKSTGRTVLRAFDVEEQTATTGSDEKVPVERKKNGASKPAAAGEEILSDVDARVLRSILEEGKVDAKTEEGLKKMLERGTAPKQAEPVNGAKKKEEEDGEFSSTFFKAVSDNAFWNSLQAKAAELVDSAKIFIANRVERDSKLLASVGLFAWERAKRDVERALPASGTTGAAVGRAVRTATRMLAANSSFVEYIPDDNFVLPPSKYGEGAGGPNATAFEQLNTPMDEIRSVSESIRDILSGKGQPPADGEKRRGLRSVAPAGSANLGERQRRAYDRRKQTVLKREREGIDRKFGRAVGAATDAAWELRRDMSVETNKPGYKAREVRKSIEASAVGKALLGGKKADALPEGEGGGAFGMFFGRSRDKDEQAADQGLQLEATTSAADGQEVEKVTPLDDKAQQPKKNAMDATAAAFDSYYRQAETAASDAETMDADFVPNGAAEIVADADIDYQLDDAIFTDDESDLDDIEIDIDTIQVENLPPEPVPPLPPLIIEDMAYERARLGAVLRACLEAPERTWLIPDVIPDSPDGEDGDAVFTVSDVEALREVITAMVCARDDLEVLAEEDAPLEPSMELMLGELQQLKGMTDSIASLAARAAGMGAAERLKAELVGDIDIDWEDEDATPSLLGKLDDLAKEVDSFDAQVAQYESDFAAWEATCQTLQDMAVEAARAAARAEAEERRKARETARKAFEAAMKKKAEEETAREAAEAARMSSSAAAEAAAVVVETSSNEKKRGGMGIFGGAFGMFARRDVGDAAEPANGATPQTGGMSEVKAVTAEFAETFVDLDVNGNAVRVNGANPQGEAVAAEVVDAQVTRVEVYEDSFDDFARPIGMPNGAYSTGRAATVEIISDDEFNTAFGQDGGEGATSHGAPRGKEMKTAVAAEEEKKKAEDPLVFKVMLRGLDVLFFVTEKTVFVGLPAFFSAGSTASTRLIEIQKEGMGSEGWTLLHNVKDGSKRY